MDHDRFIGEVQHKAHLGSRGEAERAVRATLVTLAERLAGDAPNNLASQLPPLIGDYLREAENRETYTVREFFKLVSEREGVELPKSIHHVRAVFEVLKDAVSPGQIDKILAQLPEEYNEIFKAGSEGEMELERR